jgi:putative Holliday junction resolvase
VSSPALDDSPAGVAAMRPGVRVGIDVGSVRVGVALSDPAGLLALPLETLRRDPSAKADVARIAHIVREHGATEVIVGLPLSLSGRQGPAAQLAVTYAHEVAGAVAPVPVRLVDERLSTVGAHAQLHRAGVRSRARRDVVDQAAAVIILQSALDAERASGRPPGEGVTRP